MIASNRVMLRFTQHDMIASNRVMLSEAKHLVAL